MLLGRSHLRRQAAGAAATPLCRPPVLRTVRVAAGLQKPLTNQERKAKRAESQRLGRNLCTVQLGAKGLTPSFVEGFRTALAGNELVKVRVGACDDGPEEVAEALTSAGDCVLVHKIGSTLTFYRDRSLPPPPPLRRARGGVPAPAAAAAAAPAGAAAASGEGEGGEGDAAAEVDPAEVDGAAEVDAELALYLLEHEDAYSDSDSEGEEAAEVEGPQGGPNSAAVQRAAARAARAGRPPPPPEFRIIG